ncbi:MAG: dockerin type I domain-containing protein [Coriobacteriales bacterium]|jgi:hypothetical protein|nr:dockerin type I domain-containing protein [Coriobacteriales bacterium]
MSKIKVSRVGEPQGTGAGAQAALRLTTRQTIALLLALLLAFQLIGATAFANIQAFATSPDEIGIEVDTPDSSTEAAPSEQPDEPIQPPASDSTSVDSLGGGFTALAEPQPITLPPTAPQPYPWSHTAVQTTGDFFADTYNGVGANSVFEDVNVDRLTDILSAAGDYYIVFANPYTAAGQVILADINAQAKAAGITKIYHFNPVVDNFRLDITSTNPAISGIANGGDWISGITGAVEGVDFANIPHTIGNIWTYIKSFLPVYYAANNTEQDAATKAIFDGYTSKQTLLFRFHKTNHTDLPVDASIDATYLFGEADGTVNYNQASEVAKIAPVFQGGTGPVASSTRSEYQFIKRGYDATGANPAISDADFDNGASFTVNSVTFEEVFNILNSPGEHSFYFAEFGCGDTKALIAKAAWAARDNGRPLYLIDGAFGGSIRYKTGADIDVLSKATSNAWLNIRLGSTVPVQKELNYIYGELASYLGDGFTTENSYAKASNNIQYYQNGDIGNPAALTDGLSGVEGTTRPHAPRFQYPFLFTYNKAYVEPVTLDTTAIQVTRNTEGEITKVKEYMSGIAKNDPGFKATGDGSPGDGYKPYYNATNAAYLATQRANQELVPDPEVTTIGVPTITSDDPAGLPVNGVALHPNPGTWAPEPESFSYQWYSFQNPIAGATTDTYVPTLDDYCNEISVKVTAHRQGYQSATAQSDFVQPEPAEGGEITGDAELTFQGPTKVTVGEDAQYTVGLGNIAGPGAFVVTVSSSSELELKSIAAADDEWLAAILKTNDDGSKQILFAPLVSDPDATITTAAPALKLVYTAKTAGSATVTITKATAAVITGFENGLPLVEYAGITLPQPAAVSTTVEEAVIPYGEFDFNTDGETNLLDLVFAKAFYGASATAGGESWTIASGLGIDVNNDGEITVADLIVIINNIYGA